MAKATTAPLLYDPAPLDAIAHDQRQGVDVKQRVIDLICAMRVRPGEAAKRLNRAQVVAPNGGRWQWWTVSDIRAKAGLL